FVEASSFCFARRGCNLPRGDVGTPTPAWGEDTMSDNRTVVEQFGQAIAANDTEAQDRLLADDIVETYPQSGEIIRGKANRRGIIENYPGGTPREASSAGSSAPAFEITGAGDQFTAISQITYPNGETW